MSNPLIIAIIVLAVLLVAFLVVIVILKKKSKKAESIVTDNENEGASESQTEEFLLSENVSAIPTDADVQSEQKAEETQETSNEEIIVIPRVKGKPVFYSIEEAEDNANEQKEEIKEKPLKNRLFVGGLEEVAVKKKAKKRIPFYKKLLKAEKETKTYYDTIYNKFIEYKKVHPRVSSKCTSFRFGRELVAKITYHGKTMKLHLALDVDKYNVNKYHQKAINNKKMYEEVPFTVKVKSERGIKYAVELISLMAEEKQFVPKKTFEKFDSIKELKNMKK